MKRISKENTYLLSVIIPIYNASGTLKQCLDSILQQTYRKLEVICVDDESWDESTEICRKYMQKDSRVHLIQKKNGGVASARNEGLKYVTGKYVTFIDQDDWLEPEAYEEMMNKAMQEEADMVVCSYSKDIDSSAVKMENRKEIENPITDRNQMIRYAFEREMYRGYAAFVWNKLFKTEILQKEGITFDATLKRGDDVWFYSLFASAANRAVYVDKCLYHYVQRADSITHTKNKQNLNRLSDILVGYEKAIAHLDAVGIEREVTHYLKCFYVYHASLLYEIAEEEDLEEDMERFRKSMKLFLNEYEKMNGSNLDRMERINKMLV